MQTLDIKAHLNNRTADFTVSGTGPIMVPPTAAAWPNCLSTEEANLRAGVLASAFGYAMLDASEERESYNVQSASPKNGGGYAAYLALNVEGLGKIPISILMPAAGNDPDARAMASQALSGCAISTTKFYEASTNLISNESPAQAWPTWAKALRSRIVLDRI